MSNFNIDASIFGDFGGKAVMFYKVFWEAGDLEAHVFEAGCRRVEVEIFDVVGHKLCAWRGNYDIEQKLDCDEVNSVNAVVTRVVDSITANC